MKDGRLNNSKFIVGRRDKSPKHEACSYFVLDWVHDPFAIPAARAYADACEATHPELAKDLRRMADHCAGALALKEKKT